MNTDKFSDTIYAKYHTAAEYARHIGWNKQRLHNILNKSKTPNVEEVKLFMTTLDLTKDQVIEIFLSE